LGGSQGEHEIGKWQEYEHEGCSLVGYCMGSRCLWKLGRVLEVMNILHVLQFPPLQLWNSVASWGKGDLWKRFGFVKPGPRSAGGEPCSLESVHLGKIISGRAV